MKMLYLDVLLKNENLIVDAPWPGAIILAVWICSIIKSALLLIIILNSYFNSLLIVVLHANLIVFLLCCRYLFPPGRRCSDVVIVDTDEDSMLSSEVPGKQNPLVHSDKIPLSHSCSLLLH